MKFLIIRLRHTGDTVITSPIPYVLKKHIENAEVHFLTSEVNKELLIHNPYITKVHTFNKKEGLIGYIKLIKAIRDEKYYAILDYQNTPRTAKIIMFSNAKRKLTYDFTRRWFFYNELAPTIKGAVSDTVMSLPLKLLGDRFNITQVEKRPQVYVSNESQRIVDDLIRSFGFNLDDFLITVSPTHLKATRRWRAEYFSDLINYLVENYNAKILLTYGPGEEDFLKENFIQSENIKFLPLSNLGLFAAVINRMKLHIGNDSAPQHIATGLKIPTFVILGSSGSQWIFPSDSNCYVCKGLNCQPCQRSVCHVSHDIPCMKDLTLDDVIEPLERFMKQHGLIETYDSSESQERLNTAMS